MKRKKLPFDYDDPSCPERTLGATDRYLTRNGRPWIPVMGEFHFPGSEANSGKKKLKK